MKKSRKIFIAVGCLIIIAALIAGFIAYKHRKPRCNAEGENYPMCLGGCYDPSYYSQHVDFCKNA